MLSLSKEKCFDEDAAAVAEVEVAGESTAGERTPSLSSAFSPGAAEVSGVGLPTSLALAGERRDEEGERTADVEGEE